MTIIIEMIEPTLYMNAYVLLKHVYQNEIVLYTCHIPISILLKGGARYLAKLLWVYNILFEVRPIQNAHCLAAMHCCSKHQGSYTIEKGGHPTFNRILSRYIHIKICINGCLQGVGV